MIVPGRHVEAPYADLLRGPQDLGAVRGRGRGAGGPRDRRPAVLLRAEKPLGLPAGHDPCLPRDPRCPCSCCRRPSWPGAGRGPASRSAYAASVALLRGPRPGVHRGRAGPPAAPHPAARTPDLHHVGPALHPAALRGPRQLAERRASGRAGSACADRGPRRALRPCPAAARSLAPAPAARGAHGDRGRPRRPPRLRHGHALPPRAPRGLRARACPRLRSTGG